jgi:UDP-N-acetyl-alpha-D-muramoyl-L-alanyl-L-glutamate epimerase
VVSPPTAPFEAIEQVVRVTGLPVVGVVRHLDPQLLEPAGVTGFLQGHVPVTGIISALAVLAATGLGYDAVVLSNERSASSGNLVVGDQVVNHQYSKSWAFESEFAGVLARALGERPRVFSLLRPFSEVWVAKRFARLTDYHQTFRSCNRAFPIEVSKRLDRWCGECDKCCFIDLVLAPFLTRVELEAIFDGREPLSRPDLFHRFAVLVGLSEDPKPFECVGEVGECRAAAVLAAQRGDRQDSELLQRLAGMLPPVTPAELATLLAPHDPSAIPDDFAPDDFAPDDFAPDDFATEDLLG